MALVSYLLLLIAVNNTAMQGYIAREAAVALSKKLGTRVAIGRAEVGLFNSLTLRDVQMDDRRGEPLLRAKLLSAKLRLRSLLAGHTELRSVSLLDGDIRLYKQRADSAANFAFVIEAFASRDTTPSRIDLRMGSIILRRVQLRYDERYRGATPWRFNASHLRLSDLNAGLSLRQLTPDSLSLRVRSLEATEQSGLRLDHLSLRAQATARRIHIEQFDLRLPHSHVTLPEAYIWLSAANGGEWITRLSTDLQLKGARLATSDFAPLLPALRPLGYTLTLNANASLRGGRILLHDLSLDDAAKAFALSLSGTGSLAANDAQHSLTLHSLTTTGDEAARLVAALTQRAAPAPLAQMGRISVMGAAQGKSLQQLRGNLQLTTDVGRTALTLQRRGDSIAGRAEVIDLQPTKLLANEALPSLFTGEIVGGARLREGHRPDLHAQVHTRALTYKAYTYAGIEATASLRGDQLRAHIESNDPALRLQADGAALLQGNTLSAPSLRANIARFAPATLGLTTRYGDAAFSGEVEAAFTSLSPAAPAGELTLRNCRMHGSADENCFSLNALDLRLLPAEQGTRLALRSDFANADCVGRISPEGIETALYRLLSTAIPLPQRAAPAGRDEQWRFTARIQPSDFFTHVLKVPFTLTAPLSTEGVLRTDGQRSFVSITGDGVRAGGVDLRGVRLYATAADTALRCLAQGIKRVGSSDMHFALEAQTQQQSLHTNISWEEPLARRYSGALRAQTSFRTEGKRLRAHTVILPTPVTIADTLWQISGGQVAWGDTIAVSDVAIGRPGQRLALSGVTGRQSVQPLTAHLQAIDISYILSLIELRPVSFGGRATGDVTLRNEDDGLTIGGRLDIPAFRFNEAQMGHADIKALFRTQEGKLHLDAAMEAADTGRTDVKGYVDIAGSGINLHVAARRTPLYFLRRYIDELLGDIEGNTTGTCHIFGRFKEIDFEGDMQPDMLATVRATGVRYRVGQHGGAVRIRPGAFHFDDLSLADEAGGVGLLRGELRHTHLDNIRYRFAAEAERLHVYNLPQQPGMPFFANAYGTGRIALNGHPGVFNADITLRPDARTLFTYLIDTPESDADTRLLRFADGAKRADTVCTLSAQKDEAHALAHIARRDSMVAAQASAASNEAGEASEEGEEESETDIRLNFQLDMNPAATLRVIMDEKTGDHIALGTSGTLRAAFYNKGSFDMYGTLAVERGVYKMSVQDIIRKDFVFQPGGRIRFAGNPYEGDLAMQAIYTVPSASLADLNLSTNLSGNSVRVNCLLNFSGRVLAPVVTFGLDLPSVSDEVKQMVRRLIATDEDMNMQILYLLGVGRFYTYNYADTQTAMDGQSQSSVAMKSFLSNTLSSQLNTIIGNAVGSSNWTFGTNLATGQTGWSDMEVAGILSGRLLDSRLILNGNFGYRERATSTTNFVGDFDISYLLTPSGSVSLKAYSETNDRYFSKSSLTTQGIGIKLSRDFNTLRELFTPRRRLRP